MLVNQFRKVRISLKNQFIMFFSGLRGAISFALVLNVPSPYSKLMVTTVLITVLFTIVVLGGLTLPVLNLLRVDRASNIIISKTVDLGSPIDVSMNGHNADLYDSNGDGDEGEMPSFLERFDQRYMQPFFRSSRSAIRPERIEEELQLLSHSSDSDDVITRTA